MKKPLLFISFILCCCMGSFAQSSLDSGLIAYYTFNGNSNDMSGNNHHLTNSGATLTTDRFGVSGRAYSFNGTSSYLWADAPAADFSIPSFSVSYWMKAATTQTANPRIFAVTAG